MSTDYLTEQKPLRALLIFALPMILGNLFQQMYTMADSAIVGRFVSEQALAAVGASNALTNVFICVAIGGGIGASVVVSRHFGAHRYAAMKSAVFTAFAAFLLLSVLLGLFGLFLSRQILQWLNTPADVLQMAVDYLRIYFLGLPFLFMYNVISSMFNAVGRSKIPLCFLIFSSLLNVGLDLYMVISLQMGVAGAAWATLLSQGLSCVLSFVVFLRMLSGFQAKATSRFSRPELLEMGRIALPSILQQSTVSIGMMLVQSVVNRFGSEVLAGFSAGIRISQICIVPLAAIGNAMSSYVAQNIGAGKPSRVGEGLRAAFVMDAVCYVLICLSLTIFRRELIALFLGEDGTTAAMQTGARYLVFTGWAICLLGLKLALDGVLRGAGDMKVFTVATLLNLGLRVLLAVVLAPHLGVDVVWWAEPVGWLTNLTISALRFRSGKWRRPYAESPAN